MVRGEGRLEVDFFERGLFYFFVLFIWVVGGQVLSCQSFPLRTRFVTLEFKH